MREAGLGRRATTYLTGAVLLASMGVQGRSALRPIDHADQGGHRAEDGDRSRGHGGTDAVGLADFSTLKREGDGETSKDRRDEGLEGGDAVARPARQPSVAAAGFFTNAAPPLIFVGLSASLAFLFKLLTGTTGVFAARSKHGLERGVLVVGRVAAALDGASQSARVEVECHAGKPLRGLRVVGTARNGNRRWELTCTRMLEVVSPGPAQTVELRFGPEQAEDFASPDALELRITYFDHSDSMMLERRSFVREDQAWLLTDWSIERPGRTYG